MAIVALVAGGRLRAQLKMIIAMSAAAGAALTVARSISPIITFSYLPIAVIP